MNFKRLGVSRRRLCVGGSLLAIAFLGTGPAWAACNPNSPTANGSTLCVGASAPLVVANPGARVTVGSDASIQSTSGPGITTQSYDIALQIDGTVAANGNAGILVQNSLPVYMPDPYAGASIPSNYHYPYSYPDGRATITIGASALVSGSAGIELAQAGYNIYGGVFATIDNSGSIKGTVGAAIRGPQNSIAIASITNRQSGFIGGIAATLNSLDNAGTINGGTASALDISGSGGLFFGPTSTSITTSGAILSNGTSSTIHATANSLTITNSDRIENASTGKVIESSGDLYLTNSANGTLLTHGSVAISGGKLNITNRGTITGSVIATGASKVDNSGGTINGDMLFGAADDILVVGIGDDGALATGVTGRIDGGAGLNALQIGVGKDVTLKTAPRLPDNFQIVSAAFSNGAKLKLGSGFDSNLALTVLGNGQLVNEGRLSTTGMAIGQAGYSAESTGLTIVNSGTIKATLSDAAQAAIFVPSATRIENSGMIQALGGMAIATALSEQTIVNSGTISSTGRLAIGLDVWQARVENLAGGVIEGADIAIGYSGTTSFAYGPATVVNAGRIDGDIDFTGSYARNIFIQRQGGIVNGDIRLGDGDDVYVVEGAPGEQGLLAGLNGTLDAGAGFDSILARITENATTTLGNASVAGFEQVAIDIKQDRTVTLTGTIDNAPLSVTGKGTVKLAGDFRSTQGAIIDATVASITLPGEPYSYYAFDATTIVNTGTITASYDNRGSYYGLGAIRLGSEDIFTNQGTITLTSITDPTYNSRSSAISGGSSVTNSGTILLNGGVGISGTTTIVNDGIIRQSGGEKAYGISSFRTLTNTGTISTNGIAVYAGAYSGNILTNSGTIESSAEAAIMHTGGSMTVANKAGGVIRTATDGPAILSNGGAIVENAGKITGDVWLGFSSSPYTYPSGSAYIAAGGTVEGDLRFGNGDDLLLVEGDQTGISGVIDGGDGVDSYGRSYRTSATVTLGQTIPTSFEAEAVEAITTGTVLTLTGTPLSGKVSLYGSGTIINTIDYVPGSSGAAVIMLGGALRSDADGALAFSNKGSGSFLISGTTRDFANSGSLTGRANSSSYYYYYSPTVSLTADGSRNFAFRNTGSIAGPQQLNYYPPSTVAIYDGTNSGNDPVTAALTNSGSITGAMFVSMARSAIDLSNSGTITSSAAYLPALQISNQSSTSAATVNILNTGSINASTGTAIYGYSYGKLEGDTITGPSISLVNQGSITGTVSLDARVQVTMPGGYLASSNGMVSIDNAGTIDGNVLLGAGSDRFLQRAGASVTGVVNGGAGNNLLVFELGGSSSAPDFTRFTNFQYYAVTGTGNLSANLSLPFDTLGITDGAFTVAKGSELQTRGAVTLSGGDGRESVVNDGIIHGAVELGAGYDSFTNNGSVEGSINLGAGDDRYAGRYGANNGGVNGGDGIDTLSFGFDGTAAAPVLLNLSAYSGFETFETTSGVAAVDGTLTFQTLLVNGGRLIGYAGSTITAPRIVVARDATFGSAGTVVGDIAVAGTLSPGASPGTMRVNGNVSLATGSTTLFELTPTVSDQLLVSGTLAIASGATLSLTGSRALTSGTTLDLIVADGGITGTFSTISQSSLFGFVRQTGNRVQLMGQFRNNGFAPQTAAMVDYVNATLVSGQASSDLLRALPSLLTPTGETNGAQFSLLSAEAYASASQIGIERGLTLVKAGRTSLSIPHGKKGWFGFGQALGDWQKLDGDAATGVSKAYLNSYGFLSGIGYAAGPISIGAFVGYLDSNQRISALGASTKADGAFGGVVSRYAEGAFSARLLAGYDGGSADTSRILPGQSTAKGHYKMRSMIVDASVDYRLPLGSGWSLIPQAGYSFISARRGVLNESDASPFALSVRGRTVEANYLDASMAVEAGKGAVRPWLSFGLRQQLSGENPYAQAAFTGVSGDFRSLGVSRTATLATVGAGVTAELGKGIVLYGAYQGEFGGGSNGHSGNIGLRMGF